MNEDEALKIAKSKKSTPEQLKPLIGVSDKVDLLLVKHPNASAEMLDDLSDSHFLDEKMCSAVLAHPNVSVEQLLNSGWEYPSAVFRNPSLPSIMQSQKNFLGEFEGEAFEKSFQKEVPDFVVEWLLSQGKVVYQLAYISASKRSPEELLRFRQSKHSKVIAALLERDVETYRTWAKDVGFEAAFMDQQLSNLALPAGLGDVFLRIESTYFKRGRISLPPEQTFYEDFFGVLEAHLADASKLSNLASKVLDYDCAELKRFCILGKKLPPGIDTAGYYVKSGLERSFRRLLVVLAGSSQRQSEDYWAKLRTRLESLVSANPPPSAAVKAVFDGNIAPPIPPELLDEQGKFDIGLMFANKALEQVVRSNPTFLAGFKGPKFEKILSAKNVPEYVVSWLAAKGSFEQQACFLFATTRESEVLARFRGSKHPRIIAQLLLTDEATYLAWASDLGFQMPPPFEDEPVLVKMEIDDWVERLDSNNSDLWKQLVPAEGAASTLQGELVRAIGRLQTEYYKNGMMNWGSGHYEAFAELIRKTLKSEPSFSGLVKNMIDADTREIEQAGYEGRQIASGKKSREEVFGKNFLKAADVEVSMQRLGGLINIWCQRHPDLLPFTG